VAREESSEFVETKGLYVLDLPPQLESRGAQDLLVPFQRFSETGKTHGPIFKDWKDGKYHNTESKIGGNRHRTGKKEVDRG